MALFVTNVIFSTLIVLFLLFGYDKIAEYQWKKAKDKILNEELQPHLKDAFLRGYRLGKMAYQFKKKD